MHDVVGSAAARADEHRFHRTRAEVAAAAFGRAVHDERVAALGFADEATFSIHLMRAFMAPARLSSAPMAIGFQAIPGIPEDFVEER